MKKSMNDTPKLVVTRDGIPVADQEQGIRDFKAACMRQMPHTGKEPMDCGSDLRLLWRDNRPGFHGYDYHTPERVIDTVARQIAHLRAQAEWMQFWLDAYQRKR